MVKLLNMCAQRENTEQSAELIVAEGFVSERVLDANDHDSSWTGRSLTDPVASWEEEEEEDDDDFFDDDDEEFEDDEDFDDDLFEDDEEEELDEEFEDDED